MCLDVLAPGGTASVILSQIWEGNRINDVEGCRAKKTKIFTDKTKPLGSTQIL